LFSAVTDHTIGEPSSSGAKRVGSAAWQRPAAARQNSAPAKAGSAGAVEYCRTEELDTDRLLPQKAEKKCGPDRRWKRPGPLAVETNDEPF
jgi:hypothetical protein